MQITLKEVSLTASALALMAVLANPAAADRLDFGHGLKDARAAVPVPAPIPVTEYTAGWYFRADAAYSFSDSDRFGTQYDIYAPTIRDDDGLDQFGRYGIGIGYYFSRWLRGDITIDTRNEVVGEALGTVSYTDPGTGLAMQDVIADRIRYRNGTLLFNGYVDMPVSPRFTPYVGAGVGLVLHSYSRSLNQTITCTVANPDCDPGVPVTPGPQDQHIISGLEKDYSFAMAYAFMAGVSTQVWPSTKVDIGYRYLHLDGDTFTHRVTDTGTPGGITTRTVTIPDQNIHEIRLGVRFDIH